jgi:L-aspartate oxidase
LIACGTRFDDNLGIGGRRRSKRLVHALGDATGAEAYMRAIIAAAPQSTEHYHLGPGLHTRSAYCRGTMCQPAGHSTTHAGTLARLGKTDQILASGGAGIVSPRETTDPPVATGRRSGGSVSSRTVLRDMEFMQFHPTVLYVAGSSRFLISEAVRRHGASSADNNGHRFMLDVDPRAELATRDVVAQAIVRTMQRTRHPTSISICRISTPKRAYSFPSIDRVCREFGSDITRDLIPVRPGPHAI